MNMNMKKLHRAQAELESARTELNSLGRFASVSRAERAEFRVHAAENAVKELLLAA